MPRAQSGAAMGFFPCAWTWVNSSDVVPVPTCTDLLVTWSAPVGSEFSVTMAALIFRRWPQKVVHAPGAGAQLRMSRWI